MIQDTFRLVLLLLFSLVAQVKLSSLPIPRVFKSVQETLSLPESIGLIFLIQSVYGAKSVVETPQTVEHFFQYPAVRFLMLVLVAYTGNNRIGMAVLMVTSFLLIIQVIRTPEERERHPYIM